MQYTMTNIQRVLCTCNAIIKSELFHKVRETKLSKQTRIPENAFNIKYTGRHRGSQNIILKMQSMNKISYFHSRRVNQLVQSIYWRKLILKMKLYREVPWRLSASDFWGSSENWDYGQRRARLECLHTHQQYSLKDLQLQRKNLLSRQQQIETPVKITKYSKTNEKKYLVRIYVILNFKKLEKDIFNLDLSLACRQLFLMEFSVGVKPING